MRIRILSDLHLETGPIKLPGLDTDVVVLAGDIDEGTRGVEWAKRTFSQPVVYVPGNHEYYGGKLGHTLDKMRQAAAGSNVHVLDCEEWHFEGVRFLGATLWTDYRLTGNQPLAEWDASQRLNDFKRIQSANCSTVRPGEFLLEHAEARSFLERKLQEPFEGKTVVVTHHAPSGLSVARRHHDQAVKGDSHLNASFASNLDGLLMMHNGLWIHGHTHDAWDYFIGDTRIVCNPRGYLNQKGQSLEPTGFDKSLTVEI